MKTVFKMALLILAPIGVASQVQELTPHQVFQQKETIRVVDVRTPEEFDSSVGHIEGAKLVTLGPELSAFLKSGDRKERIVFVCRSGKRSYKATEESVSMGYEATFSMKGGMLEWSAQGLPTTQN